MSMGTNILIILIVFSILLNIPCIESMNSNFCYPSALIMIKGLWEADPTIAKITVGTNWATFWGTIVVTSAVAGIVVGLITMSGQTAFVVMMAAFLFSFVSLPVSIFQQTGMPFEITLLVGGTLSVMIILSLISFIRGSEW